ncbi:MAG: hypothetical protein ACN4GZ_08235 [Acidimicrobiales bacterium]
MFEHPAVPPSKERRNAVERAWANLIGPGPDLPARKRCDVIRAARSGWAGGACPEGPLEEHVAHWVAVDAGGLSENHVELWEAAGLDRIRYLEVVGVVARLSNVDFYMRGIGAELPSLPDNPTGEATGEIHPDARLTNGWVPAMTNLRAPHVLDALPTEGAAFRDIHEPMYLPMAEIGDWDYIDVLNRPQIEFVAARASYLNECFY